MSQNKGNSSTSTNAKGQQIDNRMNQRMMAITDFMFFRIVLQMINQFRNLQMALF
jgi:hypothetical protein